MICLIGLTVFLHFPHFPPSHLGTEPKVLDIDSLSIRKIAPIKIDVIFWGILVHNNSGLLFKINMSYVSIKHCILVLNGVHHNRKEKNMSHSIKNQIFFAISQNWHEGAQKRNFKMQEGKEMSSLVFSHSEAFRLKDMAKDFGKYINDNYPNIKQIKDITQNIIQEFLNSKVHCSKQSINTYYHSLKKIDLLLEKTYKSYNRKFIDIIKPISAQGQTFSHRGVANQIPMN